MARDRDIAVFGERAQAYGGGWRGRLHHEIVDPPQVLPWPLCQRRRVSSMSGAELGDGLPWRLPRQPGVSWRPR